MTQARSRRFRRGVTVCAVGVALLLAGCAENAPQDTLEPAGPIARKIDNLFIPVFWVAAAIFFLVWGIIAVAVLKFRARPDTPEPKQVHGSTKLEIGWTVLPVLLMLSVAIATIPVIRDLAEEPKGDVLAVNVTGHLWWWEYEYPELGIRTANELHIPVDRPVRLSLHSKSPTVAAQPTGVIHSFWVPKLGGKTDVMPGRVNKMTIQADDPGTYRGQCVEFCGLSHAYMRLRVVAQSAGDFEAWAKAQQGDATVPASGPAAAGAVVFKEQGCGACHTLRGAEGAEGTVGPELTHLMSRETFAGSVFDLTAKELTRWLEDPPARKAGSKMPNLDLTGDEISQLVAYLETLR